MSPEKLPKFEQFLSPNKKSEKYSNEQTSEWQSPARRDLKLTEIQSPKKYRINKALAQVELNRTDIQAQVMLEALQDKLSEEAALKQHIFDE